MAGAKQTRFDVLVGNASTGLTTDRAYAPHMQMDITGATKTIKWTMESLDVQAISSSATIYYERLNTASKVKNFRMALVNINVSWTGTDAFGAGECIFAGRVTGQSVSHDRVTLTCEGLDTLAGKLPALGAIRFRIAGTGQTTNTVSVFNEFGKPDRRGDALTGLVNDDLEDETAKTWGTFDTAVAMATQLHALKGSEANGATFRFDQVKDLDIGTAADKQRMDKTETRPAGIFDVLQQSAAESGYVVISAIDTKNVISMGGQNFCGAMYPLAYPRFGTSNKKNITWNKYQTMAGGDLSRIPFSMQLTHDNSIPTKIVGYSGKRLVMTVLEIDPSNAGYTETTTDTDGKPILRFHASGYNSTREYIYESSKKRWEVLGQGSKWNRVGGVQPRITNYTAIETGVAAGDLIAPVYVDNQEVVYKFLAGVFFGPAGNPPESNPYSALSELLVGSPDWEECKMEWADGLDMIEKLDIQFSQDSLDVVVSGFLENDDSLDTGITVERFKAIVGRIILPVTVVVDDREVALAEHVDQFAEPDTAFYVADVTSDSDIAGFTFDACNHQYKHQFYDQIQPIRRVDDLGSWSDGTKSFTPRIDGVEIDMQTILQKNAKTDLTAAIMGDGSRMDFTIPIELVPFIYSAGTTFPLYFGDWLDAINGKTGVFAGYELPRPLMVVAQSYTQTEMRITYR